MAMRYSSLQRFAIWRAYEERCFYCREPIDYREMTLDHVIPVSLGSTEKLNEVLERYEVESVVPGFSIFDYCNLVPAHANRCNNLKGSRLFPKTATLFYLSEVQQRLPRVHTELQKLQANLDRSRVIGMLGVAIEKGVVTLDQLIELMDEYFPEPTRKEPVVLTLGLKPQALSQAVATLQSFARACDGRELALRKALQDSIPLVFEFSEPSSRTGESLTVRVVFPDLPYAQVSEFDIDAVERAVPEWEVLDVRAFDDVYGILYSDAYT
jgi:hypothetical protein